MYESLGKAIKNVYLLFWQLLLICSLVKNFGSLFKHMPKESQAGPTIGTSAFWMKGHGVRDVLPATVGGTILVMAPGAGLSLSVLPWSQWLRSGEMAS